MDYPWRESNAAVEEWSIMAKFPEAEQRLFKNKYVCRRCKTVIRAPPRKILDKLVKCRDCQGKKFKPKRKK